jgi:predicted transcriptional regulator
MNVRFKMTDKGEVAILPRKDYEALAAKAHEADEDVGNALRVVREWRGKTQLYISHKTSIGQGYISDLESGRRRGTTAALKKIADVLKVPLDLIA